MGKQQKQSLRRKAAHFVSDLRNPISDKPSESIPSPPTAEDVTLSKNSQQESTPEDSSYDLVDGPDTSSFTAFLYSLLSSSDSGSKTNFDGPSEHPADNEPASSVIRKESSVRKSLLSRGKQTLGRALLLAARLGVYRNQTSAKGSSDTAIFPGKDTRDEGLPMQTLNEPMPSESSRDFRTLLTSI